jgi:LacI family transcriptional regulator
MNEPCSGAGRPPERPTIRDVAALAGVGAKTVSRVINGERVRPKTKEAVVAAIDELGFRRNRNAALLRSAQSDCIGFVVRDVSDPFNGVLMRAVEGVIRKFGYVLLAASCNDEADLQREVIHAFSTHDVAGMIVAPAPSDQSFLLTETDAGTPIVFVDRLPRGIDGDAVMVDNVAGAATAVQHLIAHGHQRIAYLGDSEAIDTTEERRLGYERALKDAGMQIDSSLVDMSTPGFQRVASAAQRMLSLEQPATAFFTGNATLTRALLMYLKDISAYSGIVGFDDFDLAELLGITVVAQDPASIGRTAASLLMGRIQGEHGPLQHIRLRTTLVVRASGKGWHLAMGTLQPRLEAGSI